MNTIAMGRRNPKVVSSEKSLIRNSTAFNEDLIELLGYENKNFAGCDHCNIR
jgi:hypothetical protein